MLERLRKHWRIALLLAAIWIVFECWISWMAFCNAKYESITNQGHEENSCIFNGPVASGARLIFRWWAHAFEEPDAYVALFTGLLFISTVALWWSTNKLWGVTQIATEHIPLVERPYLFITLPEPRTLQAPRSGHPMGTVLVKYRVANHGKTPAIVATLCAGISVGVGDKPGNPVAVSAANEILQARVFGPHDERNAEIVAESTDDYGLAAETPIQEILDGKVPDAHEVTMREDRPGDAYVWIIATYRGVFTEGHETSACWRYDRETRRLIQYGGSTYNYEK